MSDPRRPTIKQIAALAGVSVTTVSHVLSGKRPVNKLTADRVLAIVRQYGYVPASAARRLQSGRSGMIGLVVPDIGQAYFSRIAKGVEAAAEEAGSGVIVCSAVFGVSGNGARYFDLLRDGTIDGLVCVAGTLIGRPDLRVLAGGHPIVLADELVPDLDDVSVVTSDNLEGGRLLGRHLAELGHERAVILSGVYDLVSTAERIAGFRESFPDAFVVRGDFTVEDGERMAREALRGGLSFTCVAAGNDDIALGAMRVLRGAGLRVPEDVSVVGFDDVAIADVAGITTVRQPVIEMGAIATRQLLAEIDDPEVARLKRRLPVELVVRTSTAPPPPASAG